MQKNTVLTQKDVLALKEGAKVWVECAANTHRRTGIYYAYTTSDDVMALIYSGDDEEFMLVGRWMFLGRSGITVWMRQPTPADLADNPWPDQSGQ